VFAPQSSAAGGAVEAIQKNRSLAAVIPTPLDDVVIAAEESGISPRSLAMVLERVFPGIADAARRLHTRVDVDWQKAPS
jgi:hypothetical protein